VERVEAGPKGAVITLRGNRFDNPAGLVELIQRHAGTLKLRPDQRLVYLRDWDDEQTRLKGVRGLMQALAKLARAGDNAPPAPMPTPDLVKTAPTLNRFTARSAAGSGMRPHPRNGARWR